MATVGNTEQADTVRAAEEAREFGNALHEMRVAQGRDLVAVADHLRIRKVYLQAIEEGRFDDLPGPTYATGFVRAYADYLGLDVPEVVRRYKLATQGISTQAQLVPPSPVAEGRLPTGSVLLVAAVLAAAVYGGWYYLSAEGRDPGEVVAALPQRIADMVGMKSEPEAVAPGPARPAPPADRRLPAVAPPPSFGTARVERAPASTPAPAPEPAQPAETASAPDPQPAGPAAADPPAADPPAADPPVAARTAAEPAPDTAPETPLAPGTEAASSAPPPPPAPAPVVEIPPPPAPRAAQAAPPPEPPAAPEALPQVASTPPSGPSRVVLRATSSAWVELRDSAGRRIFSRLMRSGETFPVPPGEGMTLTTGNAGGLDVLVDGRILPPLGPTGGVRRDVVLDAAALLSGASSP